jgi:O6-methylguanine-DNA--protein-cysteine methyltransferase
VIAADGGLGGYGGGLELKARLLAMERSRAVGARLL